MKFIAYILSISDPSSSQTIGPARHSAECNGCISDDSKLTLCFMLDIRPKYPSNMLANGSNVATNSSQKLAYFSGMDIKCRQSICFWVASSLTDDRLVSKTLKTGP